MTMVNAGFIDGITSCFSTKIINYNKLLLSSITNIYHSLSDVIL